MQLTNIMNNKNLYFDNYFSTYHLFQFPRRKSIFTVDTVRINHFLNSKLPSDKEMRTKRRGTSSITFIKDGIILTNWYDNKSVVKAANFIGIGKEINCTKWMRQINIKVPSNFKTSDKRIV